MGPIVESMNKVEGAQPKDDFIRALKQPLLDIWAPLLENSPAVTA